MEYAESEHSSKGRTTSRLLRDVRNEGDAPWEQKSVRKPLRADELAGQSRIKGMIVHRGSRTTTGPQSKQTFHSPRIEQPTVELPMPSFEASESEGVDEQSLVQEIIHEQDSEESGRATAKWLIVESRVPREPEPLQVAQLPSGDDLDFGEELSTPFGDEAQLDAELDEAESPFDFDSSDELDEFQPRNRLDEFEDTPQLDETEEPDWLPRDDTSDLDDESPFDEPDFDDDASDLLQQPGGGFQQQQPVPPRRPIDPAIIPDVDPLPFDLSVSPEEERRLTEEMCREELAELKASRLSDVDLNINVQGTEGEDYPYQCSFESGEVFEPRCWPQVTYMWKASGLYHNPLYFEEVELERYGHTWGPCLQPIVSGAHFFSRLPILPYCMGYTPPCECQYALGYYRPGNCAPYMCPAPPISLRGGLMQAGASVGAAVLIP